MSMRWRQRRGLAGRLGAGGVGTVILLAASGVSMAPVHAQGAGSRAAASSSPAPASPSSTPTSTYPTMTPAPSGSASGYAEFTLSDGTHYEARCTALSGGTYLCVATTSTTLSWTCSEHSSGPPVTCTEIDSGTSFTCQASTGSNAYTCAQSTSASTPTPTPRPAPVVTPPIVVATLSATPHPTTPKPSLVVVPTGIGATSTGSSSPPATGPSSLAPSARPSASAAGGGVAPLSGDGALPPSSQTDALASDYLNGAVSGASTTTAATVVARGPGTVANRGALSEAIGPVAGMHLGAALTVWPLLLGVDLAAMIAINAVLRRRWRPDEVEMPAD